MPERSGTRNAAPFDVIGAGSEKLFAHVKRTTDVYQQYSNQMLALVREQSGAPDLPSYLTRSANLMFDLHRQLFTSCMELAGSIAPSDPNFQPGTAPTLTFAIDQFNEATDAQSVMLASSVTFSSLVKPALVQAAGTAQIPADHLHLTTSEYSPQLLFVSLTDMQALLAASAIPAGTYTGQIVSSATNATVAQIRVIFALSEC